jgi:microcystin-dependent protein
MSTLKVNEVRHLSNTGTANIVLESNDNTNLQTTSTKGLTVDGTLSVTGLSTFNGNIVAGNASTDTVSLISTVSGSNNYSGFTGEMRMYAGNAAGNSPPAGWLYCNGDTIGQDSTGTPDHQSGTYQALFNLLKESSDWGNTSSAVWGTNTVKLPDMRSRAPVGNHTGAANAITSGLTARTLSDVAGTETHALTVAELAEHNHGATSANNSPTITAATTIATTALPTHTHTHPHTHGTAASATTASAVTDTTAAGAFDPSGGSGFKRLMKIATTATTSTGGDSNVGSEQQPDLTVTGALLDIPAHTHGLNNHTHPTPALTTNSQSATVTGNNSAASISFGTIATALTNATHSHTITTTNATHGGTVAANTAHNNLSPIIAVNYIIKV